MDGSWVRRSSAIPIFRLRTRSIRPIDSARVLRINSRMALFFDAAWFDEKLAAAGLRRSDIAAALGLTESQIGELWKDQRELKASDVRLLGALLGAAPEEIAHRAGVSTPVPKDQPADLAELGRRLERIEASLAEIKALILTRKIP